MMDSTIRLKRYISLNTYDDVINTCDWMLQCFQSVFSDEKVFEISFSISFSTNNIDHRCDSISEFKSNFLGLKVKPESIHVYVRDKSGGSCFDVLASVHICNEAFYFFKKAAILLMGKNNHYLSSLKDITEKTSPISKKTWRSEIWEKINYPIVVSVISTIIGAVIGALIMSYLNP